MRKIAIITLAGAAAFALPAAAHAQVADGAEITVGASGGYHDLEVRSDAATRAQLDIDDDALIYGGFVAVDFPMGENAFVGIEGNGHFGNGAVDKEYGASARLGFRTDEGSKFYVRGGYQWVDIDVSNIVGTDLDDVFGDDEFDFDTTAGDYMVGVGAEASLGNFVLRGNLDTIAFDTLRATAGVAVRF